MSDTEQAALREHVRERYAAAADAIASAGSSCCGGSEEGVAVEEGFGAQLYGDGERDELPSEAVTASLGCGNPTAVAELREGETVLDLGSGAGIDVLLSARRVGPTGKAYGLDMTEEMLALALSNGRKAGVNNVEFLKGSIEAVPLPAAMIDVVISNCVVNLSVDKPAVFAEVHRVLKAGGRVGVTDVVADDQLSAADRAERGAYVACIAGALSMSEYRDGLTAAGFTDVNVTPTHQVADGMHSAIIRASKPADASDQPDMAAAAPARRVAPPAAHDPISGCGPASGRPAAARAGDITLTSATPDPAGPDESHAISIPEDVRTLLAAPNYAHLSTLRPDGAPRNYVVWVGLEGDHVLVCTYHWYLKAKDMYRNPRVALSVADLDNPYTMASLQGRVVEVRPDEDYRHMDRLAIKYTNAPFPSRRPGHVCFVIQVERAYRRTLGWFSHNPGHQGRQE